MFSYLNTVDVLFQGICINYCLIYCEIENFIVLGIDVIHVDNVLISRCFSDLFLYVPLLFRRFCYTV